jgi:hypothetical protein
MPQASLNRFHINTAVYQQTRVQMPKTVYRNVPQSVPITILAKKFPGAVGERGEPSQDVKIRPHSCHLLLSSAEYSPC